MCQFFSAVVFRDGAIRWCDNDSHEAIITRLGLDDTAPLPTRAWVRVECVPPHTAVLVDETSTPGWYDEDRVAIDGRVMDLAQRVALARRAYDEARAPAYRAYKETVATARRAYAEAVATAHRAYKETVALALRAYDEAVVPAYRAYKETVAPARRAYDEAVVPAYRAYDEAVATARRAYDEAVSSIDGYVPAS